MNRSARVISAFAMASMLALAGFGHSGPAAGADGIPVEAPKKDFTIGWSIYAGWMPWPYAQESGIVKKWADKYGISIKLVQVNDYVESVNQYTAGKLDGVVAT